MMQSVSIGNELQASRLTYGCMRLEGDKGKRAIHAAVDAGYTLFDHADIYGNGSCEALFGDVLRESPGLRDRILVQGKCGVRFAGVPHADAPSRYNLSAYYILESVENSLQRLGIDQLDLFLLHRPDYLMGADEVAKAVEALLSSGKIAHFGVSNFSASQVEMLQAALDTPILINQVEINLHNVDALHNGVLDQCQRLGITPQAWCPLAVVAYEAWGNTFSDDDETRIREELDRQAGLYGTEPWLVALAWLLRHPAGISPIIGSTTPERIAAATTALDVDYSREDWYRLFEARNGQPVP